MRLVSRVVAVLLSLSLLVGCTATSQPAEEPRPSGTEATDSGVVEPAADAYVQPSQLNQLECFITDLSLGSDGYLATVDFMVSLAGDEAAEYAESQGFAPPYTGTILNENEGEWIIPVDDDARVLLLLDGASQGPAVPLSELVIVFSDEPGNYGNKKDQPYRITIRDDVITEIQELMTP